MKKESPLNEATPFALYKRYQTGRKDENTVYRGAAQMLVRLSANRTRLSYDDRTGDTQDFSILSGDETKHFICRIYSQLVHVGAYGCQTGNDVAA